jgi:hypothetical protein
MEGIIQYPFRAAPIFIDHCACGRTGIFRGFAGVRSYPSTRFSSLPSYLGRCPPLTFFPHIEIGAPTERRVGEGICRAGRIPTPLAPLLRCYTQNHYWLGQPVIYGTLLPLQPKTKKITHITRNRKNKNLAIPADAAAIPPNPRTAAISAMIRKVTAQPNIVSPPRYNRIASINCDGCKEPSYLCWLM